MANSRSKPGPQPIGDRRGPTPTGKPGPQSRRSIERDRGQPPIGTKFNPSTCHRCHAITLAGYAAEGVLIHLDPTPLDIATEINTLAAGRRSWHMTRNLEVIWRSGTRITYHPAGNHQDYAAFAEHSCGNPTPATISSWAWGPHAPTVTSDDKEPRF